MLKKIDVQVLLFSVEPAFSKIMYYSVVSCRCAFNFPEQLGIASPDYYCYLNQSGAYSVDGVDDVKEFRDTMVSDGKRLS